MSHAKHTSIIQFGFSSNFLHFYFFLINLELFPDRWINKFSQQFLTSRHSNSSTISLTTKLKWTHFEIPFALRILNICNLFRVSTF